MITRESRIRLSAALVVAGLATEAVTLRWAHPTAFLVFIAVGGRCLCAGVFGFLTALLAEEPPGRRER